MHTIQFHFNEDIQSPYLIASKAKETDPKTYDITRPVKHLDIRVNGSSIGACHN